AVAEREEAGRVVQRGLCARRCAWYRAAPEAAIPVRPDPQLHDSPSFSSLRVPGRDDVARPSSVAKPPNAAPEKRRIAGQACTFLLSRSEVKPNFGGRANKGKWSVRPGLA